MKMTTNLGVTIATLLAAIFGLAAIVAVFLIGLVVAALIGRDV